MSWDGGWRGWEGQSVWNERWAKLLSLRERGSHGLGLRGGVLEHPRRELQTSLRVK